jgi:hypothetical protein
VDSDVVSPEKAQELLDALGRGVDVLSVLGDLAGTVKLSTPTPEGIRLLGLGIRRNLLADHFNPEL